MSDIEYASTSMVMKYMLYLAILAAFLYAAYTLIRRFLP
jgi:hypothetical protein